MRTTESATPGPAPIERAIASLARYLREIARVSGRGSVRDHDGASVLTTGLPLPAFNGVFGFDRSVSADAVLAAVDEIAVMGLPWNVQLRPGYPRELDAALAERGLVVVAEIPFMLAGADVPLPDAAAIGVRPATTFRDVDSVLALLEQGFEMPPKVTREAFPVAAFFFPGVRTWLASADGVDVSTALAAFDREVVGIYNVATPAALRGRGYGSIATAAAMRAGFAAGAELAFLQASPMGVPVYERLGFVTAERWPQWMPVEYA